MKRTMAIAASALFAATVFAEAVPSIDGSGNYTFNVTSGAETYSGVIAGTGITVTKAGAGELTLTGANTFTGTLCVSGGTLVAAPSATAGMPALVVEDKASFKSVGGGSQWGANPLNLASITITGHGVGGQGAFIRASGTACWQYNVPELKLMGDSTVNFAIDHNPGRVNLNGYKLTKIGAGRWKAWYSANAFTADGAGGHGGIVVREGMFEVTDMGLTSGSSDNVFELAGGSYICGNLTTEATAGCGWTLLVTADSIIGTTGNKADYLVWNGPVAISNSTLSIVHNNSTKTARFNNSVTVSGAAGKGIAVANGNNDFNGTVTFSGGCGISASGGITCFNGAVDLGTGMFTHGNPATGRDDTVGGTVEFRGGMVQTGSGRSLWPKRGVTRIVGGSVSLGGAIGYQYDKQDTNGGMTTGRLEVVDVACLSHPAATYLSGTQAIPQTLFISNSVWNGAGSEIAVGNNFSVGVLDMVDSVVSNAVKAGGDANNTYGGSSGAIYQKGGDFHSPNPMNLGAAKYHTYGFYSKDGDTAEVLGDGVVGNLGYGAMHFNGGTAKFSKLTLAAGHSLDGYNSSGAGVYWQTGGATNTLAGLHFGLGAATNGIAIAAIEGEGTRCNIGDSQVYCNANCPFTGILAVNGGAAIRTFALKRNFIGELDDEASWHISVDGGILESTWYGEQWGSGDSLPDSVTVHSGGMTFHTYATGSSYKWRMPFDAPVGKIVASISLPSDPSFEGQQGVYIAPPLVKISGTGRGAAAIALFDKATRRVTGIHVVAPGTGYDDSTTATIRPANGVPDAASSFACAVTMVDAPTTGAGFTKTGAGTYLMERANTYRGPTTVAEGALSFYHAQSLPSGSGLKVCAGATADLRSNSFTVPTLEGAGTIAGSGSLTVTDTVTLPMQTNSALTVEGMLTLADGVELALTGTVADLDARRRNVLLSAAGGIVCEGAVSMPSLPGVWTATVRGNDIVVNRVRGMSLNFR